MAANRAAASPNRRSGTKGRQATRAASEPSREGTSTIDPRSGGTTRATMVTPMGRSSFASASSRIAESWFPEMATTGMWASYSRTKASNTSASASGAGDRWSYRSPATRTASAPSCSAMPTTS